MDNLKISFRLDDPSRGKPVKIGGHTLKESIRNLDKHLRRNYNMPMVKIFGQYEPARRIRNRRRSIS